jgi:PIN domain nuclease of toxin-antitoxin system
MSLLLDTHILLWWLSDHQRLSDRFRKRIADSAAPVYVSLASIWEISIKVGAGKIAATPGGLRRLPHYVRESGFSVLQITAEHVTDSGLLPSHHRDPFDRLLGRSSDDRKPKPRVG